MINNTSRLSLLIKERTGKNRSLLNDPGWEYRNPSLDIMNSLSIKNAQRRSKHGRSDHDMASVTQAVRERRQGLGALRSHDYNIRIDTEALLEAVKFNKGSIEDYLAMGLSGSMNKAEANLVAIELGRLINSAVYKHGLTIEERAANSEIGRRLAEYFAFTFFEDRDEAKALMVLVNSFIERNMILEKGYYFWDGQAYESYKPVPISVVYKLGDVHWSRETAEAFHNNERLVEETINNAVATVDEDIVSAKLGQIMAKLGLIKDTVDEDEILHDIKWVLDRQHLFLA